MYARVILRDQKGSEIFEAQLIIPSVHILVCKTSGRRPILTSGRTSSRRSQGLKSVTLLGRLANVRGLPNVMQTPASRYEDVGKTSGQKNVWKTF